MGVRKCGVEVSRCLACATECPLARARRTRQSPGVALAQPWSFHRFPESTGRRSAGKDRGRSGAAVVLIAVLVVGTEQRVHVATHASIGGFHAGHGVRPDTRGDRHRPWCDPDSLGVFLPLPVRAGHIEQLFGVRRGPLPELARQPGQPALVLHAVQQLRRTVGLRSDDHPLSGVGVADDLRGPLSPARVLESAAAPSR